MFFRSIFRIFLEFQVLYTKQLFELATVGLTAYCNRWFGSSHYLCCQCLSKALTVQNICLVLYTLVFIVVFQQYFCSPFHVLSVLSSYLSRISGALYQATIRTCNRWIDSLLQSMVRLLPLFVLPVFIKSTHSSKHLFGFVHSCFYRRFSTVFLFAFSCFVCFIKLPAPDTLVKLSVDLNLFQPTDN